MADYEGSPVMETGLGASSRSIKQVFESAGTGAGRGQLSWSPQLHVSICWQELVRLANLEKTKPGTAPNDTQYQPRHTLVSRDRPPTGSAGSQTAMSGQATVLHCVHRAPTSARTGVSENSRDRECLVNPISPVETI